MLPAAPRRIPLAFGGSTLATMLSISPFTEKHQQLQALAGFLLMVAPESNLDPHNPHFEWADQGQPIIKEV